MKTHLSSSRLVVAATLTSLLLSGCGGQVSSAVSSVADTLSSLPTLTSALLTAIGTNTLVLSPAGATGGMIVVAAPTTNPPKAITVMGDGKTPVSFWFDYSWHPQITVNANGSVTVVESHATGQTTTLNNVPAIYFSSGYGLNLPSLTPTATAVVAPPATTTTTSTATTSLPVAAVAQVPSNVIRVINNQGPAQSARIVTIGHVFAKGFLTSGSNLTMKIGGNTIPLQVDVKASHDDGSVRHAILTFQVPALAVGSSVDAVMSTGAGVANGTAINVATALSSVGYAAEMDLTMHNSNGTTTPLVLDIAKLTAAAVRSGASTSWLSGPLVSEVRVDTPINAWMHARFDVRAYSDGTIRTDAIVLNDSIALGETTFTYDVVLKQNNTTAYSLTNLQHIASTTWHREMATIADPKFNIARNMGDLAATGAIPNYDFSLAMNTGGGSSMQQDYQALQKTDPDTGHLMTDPMGSAGMVKYMPMTGGRDDIGTTPVWTARYLNMQNDMAAYNMYARADVAGSVPWHYLDPLTALPLMRDANHPQLWMDSRYLSNIGGQEKTITPAQWNALFSQPTNNWTYQVAHQPNLSYVPYLLSGRHYYLDELEAQAAMNVASTNCGYGCAASVNNEIRGQAWALREIANAAYIVPDADPMKSYFKAQFDLNMNALVSAHVGDMSHGELFGAFAGNPATTAPWQEGFYVTVLSMIAQRGDSRALSAIQWMGNFVSGLYTSRDRGFNPFFGPAYWPNIDNPTTGQPFTKWADFFNYNLSQGNFGTVTNPTTGAVTLPDPNSKTFVGGYPGIAGEGYVAIARGANAALYSATQSPKAIEAFGFIVGHNFGISAGTTIVTDSQVFLDDNGFDQNPRLKNGNVLMARNILTPAYIAVNGYGEPLKYNVDNCSTPVLTTGRDEDSLIYGDDVCSNFTIQGGNGINLLFAGDGNNIVVNSGTGDDYLFGGAGTNRLYAGAGSNYIKGGSGVMTFVFKAGDAAHDTVVNFKAGDTIEVSGIATTAAAIVAGVTTAADGSAVLHLGAHDITLSGVAPAKLSATQIVVK